MDEDMNLTAQVSEDAKTVTLRFPRRVPPINAAQLMALVGNLSACASG